MWELVKEYIKPVGIVVLGVLGAKVIEKGATKVWNAVPSIDIGQATQAQAAVQTAPQPAAPAPTPAQAAPAGPQPANASEVHV